MQTLGISGGVNLFVDDAVVGHKIEYLLEMPQLLSRQRGHLLQQLRMLNIAVHHAKCSACRLFLAVSVIHQQYGQLFGCYLKPGIRSTHGQEIGNYLKRIVVAR